MTSTLTALRDAVPLRPLSFAEALRSAELQASKFHTLTGLAGPPFPEAAISELPRVHVARMIPAPTAAASKWHQGRWFILISGADSIGRQRFSLAHEFKHVLDNHLGTVLYPAAFGLTSHERAEAAMEDDRLVARFRCGESTAFDRLVELHQERIARLVQRLLGYRGDIEDVVQDVFVDVLRGIARFDGRSSFATWTTRIAINRCRTYQRKQFVHRLLPIATGKQHAEAAHDPIANRETAEQVRVRLQDLDRRLTQLRMEEVQ